MKIGVVVGRFQVAALHDGHRHILSMVERKCDQLVVVLGIARRVSTRNPLNVAMRTQVVREAFPDAVVLSLEDQRTDEEWSFRLDSMLYHAFPGAQITLYGARDSFIPRYQGRNSTQYVDTLANCPPGMTVRAMLHPDWKSDAYRAGVIAATNRLAPGVTLSVDGGVVHSDRVLLVRKADEQQWRFPGGGVDVSDPTLQAAVGREVGEETGVIVERATWAYITNMKVADYRFAKDQSALTVLFAAELPWYAEPRAGDDVADAAWLPMSALDLVVPEHRPLAQAFSAWYQTTKASTPTETETPSGQLVAAD